MPTLLEIWDKVQWLISQVADNFRYFEDRITQIWNETLGKIQKAIEWAEKKAREAFFDAVNWARDRINEVKDWVESIKSFLFDKILFYYSRAIESAQRRVDEAVGTLTAFINSLHKQAVQLAKDLYGLAHTEIVNVSQIAAQWGFNYSSLGSYLGFMGNWLSRERIMRLVTFDTKGLDYLLLIVANPSGWVLSFLRSYLLDVLFWLLANALKDDNDTVPAWPFPKFNS